MGTTTLGRLFRPLVRRTVPTGLRRWIATRRARGPEPPRVGGVDFGSFAGLEPVSRVFGYDRGTPVDRYYIEAFLDRHAGDVRGRVLEVGDDAYTRRFGGERVTRSDVLHVHADNPKATIVADLADAGDVPSDAFDCIVLTQTLQLVYDVRTAIATLHRILRPGGVLLTTFPGISPIDANEWGGTWYWSFTRLSAERLFGEIFGHVAIDVFGNAFAATAFLQGVALEELRARDLGPRDPSYPVVIAVRAVKEAAR
jgi:SAM-dependent methyltransferase